MPARISVGSSYRVMNNRKPSEVRVLSYDPVERAHVIVPAKGGAQTYFNFNAKGVKPVKISSRAARLAKKPPRKVTGDVLLYMMNVAPHVYKVGCTRDLDKRTKAAKTWCPDVKVVCTRKVPPAASADWRFHEMRVQEKLKRYVGKDGGTEVARLPPHVVADMKNFMRAYSFPPPEATACRP